ncbi:hypothetical protein EMGBS4_17800 [Acidimicrobiaceae bacterium]|nr:hypothetical protein EMGBS4_17800 [Acidimicrobiaceae bacterium]
MRLFVRGLLVVVIALITSMWVYGLFFASKQVVNKFEDTQWAVRAQARCLIAEQQRIELADYRLVDNLGSDAIAQRASLVDKATDTIESFVEEFRKSLPSDPKGIAIVTLWLDDYEIYIADRRSFADDLRNGINLQFSETPIKGLPISEKISTFAADNRMSNCKPPLDLSI